MKIEFLHPTRWGFDILGLEGDVARAAAFPVLKASVLSYERDGYAAIFGWIQVVRYSWRDADRPISKLVDVAPQLRGLGIPYLAYGMRPTCFDAPLDTPDGLARWEALTFLTQTPDGLMTRNVQPLVGLRWGYVMKDCVPSPVPPVLAEQQDWQDVTPDLEVACPTWTFSPLPPP